MTTRDDQSAEPEQQGAPIRSAGDQRGVSAAAPDPAPIGVLVLRGERVESWHRVSYAVAAGAGEVRHAAGAIDQPIFPRSAIKPLQALALVESGAARRFEVSEAELALACASHSGEACHVATVKGWLARLGFDQGMLVCGAHAPLHAPSAERLLAAGQAPEPVHNNCSGKHAGMLTLARHLAAPLAGYHQPDHPVQRQIAATLAELAGVDALAAPAVDGCGVPAFSMTLAQLAGALARLGDPRGLGGVRRAACEQIRAAMTAHPRLVAGSDRACTAIMTAAPGLVVKTGAEGVYAAALPSLGVGLALKVEDGASRAAPVALLALLEALGALPGEACAALAEIARPAIRNHAGQIVGRIEPAPGWPDCQARGALPSAAWPG
jgi:L-asparaginase II